MSVLYQIKECENNVANLSKTNALENEKMAMRMREVLHLLTPLSRLRPVEASEVATEGMYGLAQWYDYNLLLRVTDAGMLQGPAHQ